jgi:hypothetical protein
MMRRLSVMLSYYHTPVSQTLRKALRTTSKMKPLPKVFEILHFVTIMRRSYGNM